VKLTKVVLVTEHPPVGLIDLETPNPLFDTGSVRKFVWWIPLSIEAYKQGLLRLKGTNTPIPDVFYGNIHEMYDEE